MKKVLAVFITIILIGLIGINVLSVKPQKVLLVGRLMGFEIDNQNSNIKSGETIATSSKKIGTVTFVRKDTNEFVALGHSTAKDVNKKTRVEGTCYDIKLEGINKGTKEETGNIIACVDNKKEIGHIYYDIACGIFGEVTNLKGEY